MERAVFEIILEQREEEQKAGKNVATSQRRDSPTSRRQHDFCLIIIKSKRDQKSRGIRKRTDEGKESRAAANQINGEDTCFCIFFFSERLLMVDRLIKCITKSSMF